MPSQLEKILAMALQLSPQERIALSEALAASVQHQPDEPPFSDQEIQHMLIVDPQSPREIDRLGLLGTWTDQAVDDGAEWVNARK